MFYWCAYFHVLTLCSPLSLLSCPFLSPHLFLIFLIILLPHSLICSSSLIMPLPIPHLFFVITVIMPLPIPWFVRDDAEPATSEAKSTCTHPTYTVTVLWHIDGNATENAFSVRDLFRDFFVSPQGAVDWQFDMTRKGPWFFKVCMTTKVLCDCE